MKKRFYLLGMLLAGGVALAQQDAEGRVGINTDAPEASLDISRNEELLRKNSTQPQGVSFPNFTTQERSTFENVKPGTMIFNTTKQCLEMYFGLKGGRAHWDCIPNATSAQSQNVAIVSAGFEGVYVAGVPFTDANKVKFELQNNGFSPISNVNFASAVSLQNGRASIGIKGGENKSISLQAGSKTTLSYTLTGTPEEGVLMANFNHLGLTADLQAQVGLGSASVANKDNYTVSLYYQPTNTRIQGKINNTDNKVTIKIPYTGGKGSYNAVNVNNITTAPGQNNDVNNLSLSIPAGNFGVTGELEATITVGGSDQEYLVKQKAPGEQYTIATFPIDMNGTHYNVVLKGIGGIPDKNFNVMTNGKYEHRFIYVPVKGLDGKLWLNNNLGANYANVDHPAFNPVQGAKSLRDENAYGSHFQWGRKADGHELTTYTSPTSGSMTHPNMQWYNIDQLQSYTNPCPAGYHVPTEQEWNAYNNLLPSKNAQAWQSDVLHLTYAGDKAGGWNPSPGNPNGWYWSSSPADSSYAWSLYFNDSSSYTYSYSNRSWGRPLRCRQD
ncbi:hypothetical protein [Ornithobacterium rhinotracheale]|uniref:hypothetical protein n=1 Tax=Ornithobacterium rhinotracheale TaxID=28251 RepID=UPI00403585BF